MKTRMHKVVFLTLATLSATITFFSCEHSASVAPKELEVLSLTLSQRDVQDVTRNELGSFEVPIADPLLASKILRAAVRLDSFDGGFSLTRRNGDKSKNVVVFCILFNDQTGNVSDFHIMKAPASAGPAEVIPTNRIDLHKPAVAFSGTLYAFFVEGIGDPPDVPAEIGYYGTNEYQLFYIDPEKHTLPARFALSLDNAKLRPFQSIGEGASVAVHFAPRTMCLPNAPLPVFAIRANDQWSGNLALSLGDFTQYVGYEGPLIKVNFYLLLLQL